VYFLFQKNASANMPKTLYFQINKLSGKEYVSFDVKSLTPDKDKSFAVLDYKFLTPGNYEVVAKDESKELIREYVTIGLKEATTTATTTTTIKGDYDNSIITTGTQIDDQGTITGTSPYYTIPSSGAYVIFKVDNVDKTLNTTSLIVDVYKKSDAGSYEFYETKNYDVTSTYFWIYFKYDFYSIGEYKLAVYNKDWKYINTSYVTIKAQ
jgi:hypothetical protein